MDSVRIAGLSNGTSARGGWKDTRTPFLVSAAIDAIYQVFEHRGVYFLEMLFTAIVLAVLPYVLVRAAASRVAQMVYPGSAKTENPNSEK